MRTVNDLSLQWNAEALWQQLEPLLPGISVEVVASVSSTNTAMLDRARLIQGSEVKGGNVMIRRSLESAAFGRRAADVQPGLLVAEHQTGGRGRQGRNWQSAAGASLTFSLGLPMAISDWSGLSLAVGVSLAEAIETRVDREAAGAHPADAAASHPALATRADDDGVVKAAEAGQRRRRPRVGLKWPNDLLLMDGARQGRKLGGVLIETVAAGETRFVIVGVGLNVLPFPADEVGTGFASALELDVEVSAPRLLQQVALPLVRSLRQFEQLGFSAFADRFAALDVLRGQAVYTVHGPRREGIAAGVTEQGALQLQTRDGLQSISSGEVSIRFDPRAGTAGGASC